MIRVIAILLFLTAVYFILYKSTGLYYAINDDMTMQTIASGSAMGTPDGHLVFISYTFGSVIAGLFRLVPGVDWYGLVFQGCLFLCCFLIVQRMFALTAGKANRLAGRVTGLILVILLLAYFIIFFQFTVVAGVLCATAVFLLASSTGRLKLPELIGAWLLMQLGWMIRRKVMLMTLPLFALVLFFKIIAQLQEGKNPTKGMTVWLERIRENRRQLLKILLVAVIGTVSVVTIRQFDKAAYSDPVWSKYNSYIHARSQIMDYYKWPAYEGNEAFWESMGVSKEEHEVLINMYGILPDINEEKIAEIAEYARKLYLQKTGITDRISKMADTFIAAAGAQKCLVPNILLLITLVTLAVRAVRGDRWTRIRIAAGVLAEAAILVYLLYQGRMPTRIIIIYDLQCILAVLGFRLADPDDGEKHRTGCRIVMLAACAALLVPAVIQIDNEWVSYHNKMELYKMQVSYINKHQDRIFVTPTNTIATVKQFTLRNKAIRLKTLGTYGWSVYSPWNEKKYRDLGLNRNSQILLEPGVYWLTASGKHQKMLNAYFLSEGLIEEEYITVEKMRMPQKKNLLCLQWIPAGKEVQDER